MLIQEQLREPFEPQDIEWKILECGIKNGKPWARVVPYVDSRAIQERLDTVCGAENWQTDLRTDAGGVLCGIGIKYGNEWIWKWDGASYTERVSYKGGISGAIKRAAALHGLGRYLYGLPAGWAVFVEEHKGRYRNKIKKSKDDNTPKWYDWNPPEINKWALPNPERIAAGIIEDIKSCQFLSVLDEISERKKESIFALPPELKGKIAAAGKAKRAELNKKTDK